MNEKENNIIHALLKGASQFFRPPGHHTFAFDFVQTDAARKKFSRAPKLNFFLASIKAYNYYCWEKQVYAPIDGEIFLVADGWPDYHNTNLWKTTQLWYNTTCHFLPKMVGGRLKNASIRVKEGQRVAQGDLKNVLSITLSLVYPSVEFLLHAHEKFDKQGELVDNTSVQRLKKYIEGLLSLAKQQNSEPQDTP